MVPTLFLSVTLFAQQSAPQQSAPQQSAPQPSSISDEEYVVYAAILELFQKAKKSSHPIVSDHTATFSCHTDCNGLNVGGCNGLRFEDESPAQRLATTRHDIQQLTVATTDDFESKNQSCSQVEHKIPTKIKYLLFGKESADPVPEDWDSPDYFHFSRVGFNAEHTQALVVVGFTSGTKAKDSGGKYFFLVKQSDKWHLVGTSDIWEMPR